MPITLTVGTNTYLSLADAETYFATRLFSTDWTGTDDIKSQALIMATKKIDRQILKGIKATQTQALQFPRAFYVDDSYSRQIGLTIDNIHGEGWYVETSVNQRIKDAQCEEAIALLAAGTTANKRAELQAQGVKSFTLGGLSETYMGQKSGTYLLSLTAKELLNYATSGGVRI